VGSTSLSIYGPGKHLIAAVNVVVGPDIQTLRARMREMLPEERDVAIRDSNGSLVLTGTVTSPVAVHQIEELAETLDPGKVVNMLGVEGTQQVMLSVRFVEMERTTAKNLSVNLNRTSLLGNPLFNFGSGTLQGVAMQSPGAPSGAPPGSLCSSPAVAFGCASLTFLTPDGAMNIQLDALESKGLIKTLAEPNLVAMSGDTASFLAGGQIPVPIAQTAGVGGTAITITYQDFGISLGFTPTILKDGMINLVVKPEVSSIDPAVSVQEAGVTIPGLKVRRASTTVEMRDGESLTIAGLLSDNYQNQMTAFPWLGDIPVLGALFRSPNFQANKTELVIVVTPHLVVARRGPVALPTDHFTAPSDYELFLFGMLAGKGAHLRPEDRALLSQDPATARGGVEGPYGHVLY
jgi:pilus assembly protein CpaC